MKLFILATVLMSQFVFADGIPVPMEKQTPYNWECQSSTRDRVSLHLFVNQGTRPTLYVSYFGGTVGTRIPQSAASALLSQKYSSINGRSFTDSQFKRTLSFESQGSDLDVTLQDGTFSTTAVACRASFSPQN